VRVQASRCGRQRLRRFLPVAGALPIAALLWPAAADAHGLVGRAYLPVPAWLFAWAAGIVLIVSFFALGSLWSTPRLEAAPGRRLFALPAWLEPVGGALGVALFALVLTSGILGSQLPTANLAPTAVFVLFWVGVPILSAIAGDVFAALSPWRAIARGARWLLRRTGRAGRLGAPRPYPERLGRWPAVAGIAAFAWLELVFVDKDHPATLAVLAVAYALVQLVGMAWFGIERWTERGDGFAVAFNLFSRLSVLEYRDRAVWRRRPLSGLTGLPALPGTVALLCTMIGTTSFDGFMNGPIWRSIAPSAERGLRHLGLGGTTALESTFTLGMVICVLVCAGLYWLGIKGMQAASGDRGSRELGDAFVHSLAPIAFGYLLAHYFSLLVTQGQAAGYLISDPFGIGSNIFGTAGLRIDYGLISGALIWYVQVLALVGGHVSGLALAHDRALVVYGSPEAGADSQRWMLVVMVTFTCLGLWLLSAVNT
jgi:hypothetical protein